MTEQSISGTTGGGGITPAYLQASHTVNHVFTATNTPEAIPLNTNDEIINIAHSETLNNEQITVIDGGVYFIAAQPQVFAGLSSIFHMWLSINNGGGFVDLANSNVELTLPNNQADVIPLLAIVPLAPGDIIRVMASVDDIQLILEATTVVGEPLIPAIIFTMYRIF